MRNPKILIFSATFGAGHIRASEAIMEAISVIAPSVQVIHLDFGSLLNKRFYALLKDLYISMLKHTPRVWGRFYYATAHISHHSLLQRYLNSMGQKEYLKYIAACQPDVIICTYPTVAGVLSNLRVKQRLEIPIITVVTDYTVHSQWIHAGVDSYIVGCQEVYEGMVSRGIDPPKIRVTGIPVNPRFESELNRTEILNRLGMSPELPTVLIMGGAYGVLSELKTICTWLGASPRPVQSLVVCGRDKKLYASLSETLENSLNPMLRFGYVNNVDELMSVADLVITKAGGLITSEALTKRVPLVIFKPIPGQEEENAKFISKVGAGRTAGSLPELMKIVSNLLENPDELRRMSMTAACLPGNSAQQAAEHILNQIKILQKK